ncbi:MAG: hypothetical protein IKX23_06960, partial [Treponema sp.]|nr:hypothetical protein [Treponema sp.]
NNGGSDYNAGAGSGSNDSNGGSDDSGGGNKDSNPGHGNYPNGYQGPQIKENSAGFKETDYNGKKILVANLNNKKEVFDVSGYYLTVGKYASADTVSYEGIGLLDKDGNIIHVLSEEQSVKNFAEAYKITEENTADVLGGISAATGTLNDILDPLIDGISDSTKAANLAKISYAAKKVSQITGTISIVKDTVEFVKDPSVSSFIDIGIDAVGFIPGGGAAASVGLDIMKNKTEKAVEDGIYYQTEYQINKIIYNFDPSKQTQMVTDKSYQFMNGIKSFLHGDN